MKVIYIRDSKSKGYLRIGILDGGEKREYTVSEAEYRECGSLLVGDEIDGETVLALAACDMRYDARRRALRILAYSDNNERTLVRKLISKGVSRDAAEATASEMVSLGYIDEVRQLERIIEREVCVLLTGKRKLYAKLTAKGYDKSRIALVIDDLIERGVIDFKNAKEELLRKRLPECCDDEDKKQLLYKFGH